MPRYIHSNKTVTTVNTYVCLNFIQMLTEFDCIIVNHYIRVIDCSIRVF